jgi:hypothetical protein
VVVVDMSIVDEVSKPTYNSGASHCIALLWAIWDCQDVETGQTDPWTMYPR